MRAIIALLKMVFVLFLGVVVVTQVTDADLLDREFLPSNTYTATTLDFSNRDTATHSDKTLLFQETGFVPGGFSVEALRLQKEGELNFTYQLGFSFISGDQEFCQQLQLRILKEWETVYESGLTETQYSGTVNDTGHDNLVLVLSLPDDASKKGNCVFDFHLVTQNNRDGKVTGFSDEERLQNIISAQN